MNKSLGNIYRNNKSLSGLNNIDAFNLSVDGVLKTANVSNIDTAITTLQGGSGVDLTDIEADIAVNTSNISTLEVCLFKNRIKFLYASRLKILQSK